MNRAEYLRMIAIEPATPNQVGAVHGEFRRLGLDGDRPARLAAAAALLGLDDLGSSRDLSMGQAGYLIHTLRGLAGAEELAATRRAGARARGAPGPCELMAAIAAAWQQIAALREVEKTVKST